MRVLLIGLFLVLSSGCFASTEETVEFIYAKPHLKLNIPQGSKTIAVLGDEENTIILKYSKTSGKDFLIVSDMTESTLVDFGCDAAIFLADLYQKNKASKCSAPELAAFSTQFIANFETGSWQSTDFTFYYSFKENDHSFVFAVSKAGEIVKVDTDFLDKQKIKSLFGNYLE